MKIELTLKNSKLRSYHLIGWIFIFLNLFALAYLSFYGSEMDRYLVLAVFLISILTAFIAWGDKVHFMSKTGYAGIPYVLMMALWIKWEFYWMAGISLLLYVLYIYSVRKFEVLISAENIIYPSFPKKLIRWNELQNLIVKDGILTIDFKNNKLLQNEIAEDNPIDERKINEFCREQLTK
jgi:hypothetical protein